jgi:hypothetical protein
VKLLLLFILTAIAVLFNSCCLGCTGKYYSAPMYISSQVINYNDKLYFQYYSQQGNAGGYQPSSYNMNESYLFELDTSTHTWKEIASKVNNNITILNDYNETRIQNLYKPFDRYSTDKILISDDYYVVIEQNSAKIKQLYSNTLVDKYALPTLDDIVSNLGISYNTFEKIEYYPLFNHTYNASKKEYLVLLSFDKQRVHAGDTYHCYYVTMKFQNDIWNYSIVKKSNVLNIAENSNNLMQDLSLTFNDGNLSVSYIDINYDYQIMMKDDNISFVKSTPEDLMNKESIYTKFISQNYSFDADEHYFGNYGVPTFDEKGNMHLFYNKKEDIKNDNYEYFWYGYFEKGTSTTPLYEQKILWQ